MYRAYYGYVFNTCSRYLSSSQVDEAVQDTFIKVFTRIQSFRKEGVLRAWIHRIAVNECLDRLRKSMRNNIVPLDRINYPSNEVQSGNNTDAGDEVLRALELLTPQYRAVFNLYVMDGYSHEEIADMLDIKASTSRSNYKRAKDILKAQLGSYVDTREKFFGHG